MAKRPGVMLYFADWRPIIGALDEKQGWKLVKAILQYAEDGESPELEDPIVRMIFAMLAEKVDRDGVSYQEKCRQREYAVYCRECDRRGETRLDYSEWVNHREISTDINRYQPYLKVNGTGNVTVNGEVNGIVNQEGEGEVTGVGEREREREKERIETAVDYERRRKAAIDRLEAYKA